MSPITRAISSADERFSWSFPTLAIHESVPYPARRFTGLVNAFDPFNTGQALEPEVEISVWRCDREDRTCVFFCVSPTPRCAAQWAPMRAALSSFRSQR